MLQASLYMYQLWSFEQQPLQTLIDLLILDKHCFLNILPANWSEQFQSLHRINSHENKKAVHKQRDGGNVRIQRVGDRGSAPQPLENSKTNYRFP